MRHHQESHDEAVRALPQAVAPAIVQPGFGTVEGVLSLQRSAGNQAVARAMAVLARDGGAPSPAGNRAFSEWVAARRAVARTPAPTDTPAQRAPEIAGPPGETVDDAAYVAGLERAAFLATCPRLLYEWKPTTRSGLFDVRLEPPHLTLTVKVLFVGGGGWKTKKEFDTELPAYQKKWLSTVQSVWRPGMFTFWSQRLGWEDFWVTVIPEFRAVEPHEKAHVLCRVWKVPEDEKDEHRSKINQASHIADFGTHDNEMKLRDDGRYHQRTSVHEAGHMLGFGEEYVEGGAESTTIPADHSKLAERQLGITVYLGKSDTIMSAGEKILPQHSVTMREALEMAAVPYKEWGLQPSRAGQPRLDASAPRQGDGRVR